MVKKITFSPVTRLSGLLSVEIVVDRGKIVNARTRGTMFRGYEWIMRGRKVTDAVYMTQRICGICSLAHGAVGSYLLDELYGNIISENAQYLRNIMFAADFLQNHIRHFYFFGLPDFVKMPEKPPFLGQDLNDLRLNREDNRRLVDNYYKAVKAAQESHQLLALFGGKIPNQHSFVHGGVTVAPTADKINQAKALIESIQQFVQGCMIPDTELISRAYRDYFQIGVTPLRLISFGLFPFGPQNDDYLWPPGVIINNEFELPQVEFIEEQVPYSYYEANDEGENVFNQYPEPAPFKPEAYSYIKTVLYKGQHFETGPYARGVIRGDYRGRASTMDRIVARSLEALKLAGFIREWLTRLEPGPPPLNQNEEPVKDRAVATTGAMRGALLHSAIIEGEEVKSYNVITPTTWNFSPRDKNGNPGPVERALIGTEIPGGAMLETIVGRIIRSFDPCISCGTHVYSIDGKLQKKIEF
ncbi:nickel-dependent hydrogenase large subunit [Halothermothrix orenii H 168]|uniref:Nickel-dependent hydrogenase large subunit n=2 Tax=Halothermothrix orenii TaxID=31909 RepID=B8D1R8_HALOH|nr:nickel-dependent hydrogenase large subunit [Halothermothrix orenii H 168]